jgi:hypothetical protein
MSTLLPFRFPVTKKSRVHLDTLPRVQKSPILLHLLWPPSLAMEKGAFREWDMIGVSALFVWGCTDDVSAETPPSKRNAHPETKIGPQGDRCPR